MSKDMFLDALTVAPATRAPITRPVAPPTPAAPPPAPPAPPQAAPQPARQVNRFHGTCADCGGHVAPRQGYCEKNGNAVWTVHHHNCPAPRAPQPVPPPAAPAPVPPPANQRPDFADDIDARVAALVAAGDVVFDAEADAYRAPRWQRYRFGA